ncbi:MAG: polysaccharide deacetylase family protein [bacterium]
MKVILTYHCVSSKFDLGINTVRPSHFRGHLKLLKSSGLRSVTVSDLLNFSGNSLVAITFDDGYSCIHHNALDLMVEFGFKGTVSVVVGAVGRSNHWDVCIWSKRLRHLTWEQIGDLSRSDFEIISHTMSHHDLTRLPLQRLRWELEASKKTIEDRTGREVRGIAYPFGRTSRQVIEEARGLGYSYGLLSCPFPFFNDQMRLGRFSIHSIDSNWSVRSILGLSKGLSLVVVKCKLVSWLSGGSGIVKQLAE